MAAGLLALLIGVAIVVAVFLAVFGGRLSGGSWRGVSRLSGLPGMVVVPAGSAIIGSAASDPDHATDEAPQHLVKLAKPLAVGRYPITRAEYVAYARDTSVADSVVNTWFAATDRIRR